MERIGDIQKFILDVYHDRDVTYTKQMREDALCLVAGVKWANKMYVQELTQFVFDMTCGNPRDALKALQRKEQLVSDLENAFGNAGIKKELDPDKLVKGINEKALQVEKMEGMFRDTYNKLIAMPEEGTYHGSKVCKAEPKTDGKERRRGYTVERVYNTDKDFPILRGN